MELVIGFVIAMWLMFALSEPESLTDESERRCKYDKKKSNWCRNI